MKEMNIKVYQTSDGKQFQNEEDALEHEKHLECTSYFLIYGRPDLTEGRHDGVLLGYISVDRLEMNPLNDGPISEEKALEFARMFCQVKVKAKEYVMPYGYFSCWGPMHNWRVVKTTFDEIKKDKIKRYGFVTCEGFSLNQKND